MPPSTGPEAADTPDQHRPTSGMKASPLRFLTSTNGNGMTILFGLACGLLALALLPGGWWIFSQSSGIKGMGLGVVLMLAGGLAALVGPLLVLAGLAMFRSELKKFPDSPLAPGVVVSTSPMRVACLIDMARTEPGSIHWLAKISPFRLRMEDVQVGTRVPCFVRFEDKQDPWRWRTAYTNLVPDALGDPAKIARCNELIGEDAYRKLESCVGRVTLHEDERQFVVLDRDLNHVDDEWLVRHSSEKA